MSKILRITPGEDCSSETSTHVIGNGSHISGNFKRNHSLEKRRAQIERVSREIYPERIPVIVERAIYPDVACITKNKFLVPADLTLGQFGYAIRKMIHLGASKAIFLFVNNTLPRTSALMSDIYAANADEDGYLYIVDLQWRGCLKKQQLASLYKI